MFPATSLCESFRTISLLSMPTLRRLAATELISFSLIHDLKSLTAKAADTPEQTHPGTYQSCVAPTASHTDKLGGEKRRCRSPSLTRFSLKRLFRMEADMLPLASRMPVSMASLLRSDSVNPFRNSSNCGGATSTCVSHTVTSDKP